MPPPNNVKNDFFLYNPPHNSFALSNNNMFENKDIKAENNSNNNFDITEHESTIFNETSQPSSNHLLFNNSSNSNQNLNNISTSSNKTTSLTKANQKKFNYRQPPPVKKPTILAEEIQANLPSVLIINSNNSSSGIKEKVEEITTQKLLINDRSPKVVRSHLND